MLFAENHIASPTAPPSADQPLAARLRPRSFGEYVGQQHLIGPGRLLRRAIDADRFTAVILHGPPGVGKTTLAELIATLTASHFTRLSAVGASVADLRQTRDEAVARRRLHQLKTILFVDEIHRFNRAQQDVLLPDVETGVFRLIGATTENPYFHLVGPLLSRAQVFQLEPLSTADISALLARACQDERAFPERRLELDPAAVAFWAQACEGDGRRALTALEIAVLTTAPGPDGITRIDLAVAEESLQRKALAYGDDGHYDSASAFIKSMRGSDPDAAVYWLAKMLEAGEDLRFIARRIVIFAAEDIGNADPRALSLAVNAMQAVEMIGMPEARIILSQAVTYCATCPKSNAAIKAIDRALADVRGDRVHPVPIELRDAHYQAAQKLGHGADYQYPHDYPGALAPQEYMTVAAKYYEPSDRGYESRLRERLQYWEECRRRLQEESRAEH